MAKTVLQEQQRTLHTRFVHAGQKKATAMQEQVARMNNEVLTLKNAIEGIRSQSTSPTL